jgi:hypothetical protein|nr:MAG TPA: hypothetical protein [Caudoviricetes sp.]
MRKIVVHLNDEVFGISIDDNASDKEIREKVLEEVIDRIAYDYEEVDEWPKTCAFCEWHVDRIKFCLNKDVVTCNDVQGCEKWEAKEEYE